MYISGSCCGDNQNLDLKQENANLTKEDSIKQLITVRVAASNQIKPDVDTVMMINYIDTLVHALSFSQSLAPAASILSSDLETAYLYVKWAWDDTGPCSQEPLCSTYIGNFEITFNGSMVGFRQVVARLGISAHACIVNAKKSLLGPKKDGYNPNYGLAVAWVMASQIHNKAVSEWIRNHGDATIRALSMVH